MYSRLSAAAQHQVFAAHNGRRVVLATNVAETSLTVPGITGVVDSGLARISRWSLRTKVQRLPVEEISQASAKQRSGRCGRIAPGIAIRLYSEADFEARPEFTDPEVLRTSLASVILQLTALRMGEVTRFPFLDPPDPRAVRDAVALLEELGALTNGKLTKVGHTLARLPVDPRMGRMVIEADRLGCLREVLIIVAALSGQDPRERPEQHRARADQLHARFVDPTSDFVSVLNLWRYLKERRSELGSSAFRRLCRDEHLNFIRVREWQDLERQLRQVSRESSMTLAGGETPAPVDSIHQAVLAGLLSHIGVLDRESAAERRATMKKTKSDQSQKRRPGDYRGARGARFSIFPGSGVAQARPDVVMAAEIVETSALWGRQVAAIDPAWAERLAGDLAKRVWEEPHWSQRRASAQAYEKVTLYGVPIVTGRLVPLGKRDPGLARELFIRHALLGGEWRTQHDFLRANALLLRDAAEQEERARRRDIVVDEEILFDFYDERIPANVVSGAHFDTWWKQEHRRRPDLLTFTADMLVRADALADVTEFPDVWRDGERHLPVQYRFEPGHRDDGVTIDIPLDVVGVIVPDQFSWQVEGLREDLVIALLRSLPKPIRVHVVPIPDFARTFLAEVTPGEETMVATLGRHIRTRTGVFVPDDAWDLAAIPEHLRATFRVLDDQGQVISHGKDLTALTRPLIDSSEEAVRVSTSFDRVSGATSWIFGDIPESVRTDRAGREVEAFPALIDEGGAVGLGVFGRLDWAQAQHRRGLRRLAAFRYRDLSDQLTAGLRQGDTLLFASAPDPVKLIASDCVLIAVEVEDPQAVRSAAAFESACPESGQVLDSAQRYFNAVIRVCQRAIEVDKALSGRIDMAALGAMTQMKAQFSSLMSSGFVATAGPRIVDYPRYFEAIMRRAERIGDAARDVNLSRRVDPFQTLVVGGYAALPDNQPPPADLERARWLVEEFRVSLWAQQLGTSEPVSEERLRSLLS